MLVGMIQEKTGDIGKKDRRRGVRKVLRKCSGMESRGSVVERLLKRRRGASSIGTKA